MWRRVLGDFCIVVEVAVLGVLGVGGVSKGPFEACQKRTWMHREIRMQE